MLNAIGSLFQLVLNWFYDAFAFLFQFLESVVLSLYDALKDFFYFCIDSVLNLAVSIVSLIDFSGVYNPQGLINSMPAEVLNMMGLLGLGECTVIIVTAIITRLLLQLIPFVRLGS